MPKFQSGYSGTFDVITVMEYYQPFIQKRLREASAVKFILNKTAVNFMCITKYTYSKLFFAECPEYIGKVPV